MCKIATEVMIFPEEVINEDKKSTHVYDPRKYTCMRVNDKGIMGIGKIALLLPNELYESYRTNGTYEPLWPKFGNQIAKVHKVYKELNEILGEILATNIVDTDRLLVFDSELSYKLTNDDIYHKYIDLRSEFDKLKYRFMPYKFEIFDYDIITQDNDLEHVYLYQFDKITGFKIFNNL